MTAMPQMVALFNGVGGGAAALSALAELLPDEAERIPGQGAPDWARTRAAHQSIAIMTMPAPRLYFPLTIWF